MPTKRRQAKRAPVERTCPGPAVAHQDNGLEAALAASRITAAALAAEEEDLKEAMARSRTCQQEEDDFATLLHISTEDLPEAPWPGLTSMTCAQASNRDLLDGTLTTPVLVVSVKSPPSAAGLPADSCAAQVPNSQDCRRPSPYLASARVLKVACGQDRRRLSVTWSLDADKVAIFDSISSAVRSGFSLSESNCSLQYIDDEGDGCTLVASTVSDFLLFAGNGPLKLTVRMEAINAGHGALDEISRKDVADCIFVDSADGFELDANCDPSMRNRHSDLDAEDAWTVLDVAAPSS